MSVVAAAAITAAAVVVLWSELDVKTDLVGYSVFADFNGYNYFRAYYLIAAFFPLAALGLFLLVTRLGRRFGLAVPPHREDRFWPPAAPPPAVSPLEGDPPLVAQPKRKRRLIAVARVGFIGAILGLEVGIGAGEMWIAAPVLMAYGLLAFAAGAALDRQGSGGRPWQERLPAINALGAPLTVLGLVAVSWGTEVKVLADGAVDDYPWFPVWIALPAAAILIGLVASRLRRSGAAPLEIERWTLLLIAAPVGLFVLLAALPGATGHVETFESGQRLVAGELVGPGWFPWRDILVIHGVLADGLGPKVGFALFDESYWGEIAGNNLILAPLYLLSAYFLFAYLFGRNWLFLVFAGLVLLDRSLAPPDFRFILLPVILLLLAAALARPNRPTVVALAILAVGQVFVTPESAPALIAVTVVLILFEWSRREPGERLASSFDRSIWFLGSGFAFGCAGLAYLASQGALDDFVYLSRNLLDGHIIKGALPPGPNNPEVTSDLLFWFLAVVPVASVLISFAYAVARLRLRRGFSIEDWVMAALVIFTFLYYPKFLARMDDHVYQPFVQALPLALYIVYRAVTAAEDFIRERFGRASLRAVAHPLCLTLVVAMALISTTWTDRIADAPERFAPTADDHPRLERLGYADEFDVAEYRDLRRVVDAYLEPGERFFDFTGEPGLFFFLMERDPATRYMFTNSITDPSELQEDVIERLRKARPKLIAFDYTETSFIGLSNYDGTPSMVRQYLISRWILDRYRPLLKSHGHTFYVRRDQPPPDQAGLSLSEPPATSGVDFMNQQCTWGYAPSFLAEPAIPEPGAEAVNAGAHSAPDRITVVGWSGDPKTEQPAREVLATIDGEVVGRIVPDIVRTDLTAFGLPQGFERSGFRLQITVPSPAGRLRMYGVSRDGAMSELVEPGEKTPKGSAVIDGRRVTLDPSGVYGQLNSVTRDRSLLIDLPPGSRWDDYRWLELESRDGFREGEFALYDLRDRPSAEREISFKTLDRSPKSFTVPVASCSQWHGYQGNRLFLNFNPFQDISVVRLIR